MTNQLVTDPKIGYFAIAGANDRAMAYKAKVYETNGKLRANSFSSVDYEYCKVGEYGSITDIEQIIGNGTCISFMRNGLNAYIVNPTARAWIFVPLNDLFANQQICITGEHPVDRKALIPMIKICGGEFCSSVSNKTDMLVVRDNFASDKKTTKIKEAEKRGVKIATFSQFVSMVRAKAREIDALLLP